MINSTIMSPVKKAISLGRKYHSGQMRKDGITPFFEHPLTVMRYIQEFSHDETLLISSVLHDTLEDTVLTEKEILTHFGSEVLITIKKVSINYYETNVKTKEEIKEDYFNGMKGDYRAILIKMADRLHNLNTLEYLKKEKQLKNIEETTKYFPSLYESINLKELTLEESTAFTGIYTRLLGKIYELKTEFLL